MRPEARVVRLVALQSIRRPVRRLCSHEVGCYFGQDLLVVFPVVPPSNRPLDQPQCELRHELSSGTNVASAALQPQALFLLEPPEA